MIAEERCGITSSRSAFVAFWSSSNFAATVEHLFGHFTSPEYSSEPSQHSSSSQNGISNSMRSIGFKKETHHKCHRWPLTMEWSIQCGPCWHSKRSHSHKQQCLHKVSKHSIHNYVVFFLFNLARQTHQDSRSSRRWLHWRWFWPTCLSMWSPWQWLATHTRHDLAIESYRHGNWT